MLILSKHMPLTLRLLRHAQDRWLRVATLSTVSTLETGEERTCKGTYTIRRALASISSR